MPRQFGNPAPARTLHSDSAALSSRTRILDIAGVYAAFALIAAIIFGSVFSGLF